MAKRPRKDESFIKKAYYKGGSEAMKDFILKNLKYPEAAATNKIEGTVHLRYHINHKGIVFKAQALTKFGYGLEEEAIRLVKLLRFEIPKNNHRNLKIIFNKTTSIHFRLPKQKSQNTPEPQVQQPVQQVQYTIVPTKKEEPEENIPPKKSFTYTVNINK